jgi:hypothetical protein
LFLYIIAPFINKMTKYIVLISGYKEAGKDTYANHLVSSYGFVRFAFADKLKDDVSRDYGFNRKSLDDPLLKESVLLDHPVIHTDDYSKSVQKLIYTHFRTENNEKPGTEQSSGGGVSTTIIGGILGIITGNVVGGITGLVIGSVIGFMGGLLGRLIEAGETHLSTHDGKWFWNGKQLYWTRRAIMIMEGNMY